MGEAQLTTSSTTEDVSITGSNTRARLLVLNPQVLQVQLFLKPTGSSVWYPLEDDGIVQTISKRSYVIEALESGDTIRAKASIRAPATADTQGYIHLSEQA